uniref:Thymus, brain and testes associated n=1 Tax=Gouania willdenowi TaxID=441366 RepID=A0A8C5HYV4_GOUWI
MSSCHFEAATANSPSVRGTTGAERSLCGTSPVPLTADFTTMMSKSCPRFGSLSHHSFFSRHNPHPNRVRHIQGLNGRPICSVRDDWFVTSSLFPHPLLKSHVFRTAAQPVALPQAQTLSGGNKSEAWRDELKELAAKVSLTSQEKKAKKVVREPLQAPWVRSKTQSSPGTGRIIPPHTKSSWRRSNQQRKHPLLFQDQELMVKYYLTVHSFVHLQLQQYRLW